MAVLKSVKKSKPLRDRVSGVSPGRLRLERGPETGQAEGAQPVHRAVQVGLEPLDRGARLVHDRRA